MSAGAFMAGFSSGPRLRYEAPAKREYPAELIAIHAPLAHGAECDCVDCDRPSRAAAPRFTTPTCRACNGAGFTRTASTRTECGACNGAGVTLEPAHGAYEPVVEGEEPELLGRELASLSQLRERLLSWVGALAEAATNGEPLSIDTSLMLRDELVLHAAALDEHMERADEAASERELRDDLRDDELQRLHEHVADVEREREEYRVALAAEQKLREQDAATIGHQRVEMEAMRVERDAAVAERSTVEAAHGILIVQALQYRTERDETLAQNKTLALQLALKSARGAA
jgi:hypothetical protein